MSESKNEKISNGIKDCIIKVDNACRTLQDGKEIITYNKLLGIRQKLVALLVESSGDNKDLPIEGDDKSNEDK